MVREWLNKVVFLFLVFWLCFSSIYYLSMEIMIAGKSLEYVIEINASASIPLQYSLNIAPGQIGAKISEIQLKKGSNQLRIPRPLRKEVISINFLSTQPVELGLSEIKMDAFFEPIIINGAEMLSSVKLSYSDLSNSESPNLVDGTVQVSLSKNLNTISIKKKVVHSIDNQLIYWPRVLAFVLSFVFLILFSVFSSKFQKVNYQLNFFLLFMVLISTPIITSKDNRSRENRELAPFPNLDQNIWKIPREFNKYYNDHFPFRNELRYIGNAIKYRIFNISPKPDAVRIGKEGWLFNSAKDVVVLNQGFDLYSKEELETIKNNLEAKSRLLEKHGITYYLTIPPMKHRVYKEYLPESIKQLGETTKWEQLMNYLKEHSSVRLIDPYATLIGLKKKHVVYYQTDTHWNKLGAFYAYQLIIDRIRMDFPNLSPTLQIDDFVVEMKVDSTGDLVGLIDMKNTFARDAYYLTSKDTAQKVVLKVGSKMEGESSYVYYEHIDKNQPKLLLYRDSFSEYLREHLAEHFSVSGIVWGHQLNDKRILKDKPDILVQELMERFIDKLLLP